MGISESKKNSILPYAVAGVLFVVACVLQQTDDLVSDWNTSKFMVLAAQCIFFGILTYWTVSVINRVSDKNIRTGLATTIILMSMVLLLKLVKYNVVYEGTAERYFWYSYYIPQCIAPVVLLKTALGMARKSGKPLSNLWNLLFMPAVLLILLVFTNDVHEQVFSFAQGLENANSVYKWEWGYYLILAWIAGLYLANGILLFIKCRISHCRKKAWIPLVLFVLCLVFCILREVFNPLFIKMPETVVFSVVIVCESLIRIGFIPSNTDHAKFFDVADVSAVITDKKFDVELSSKNAPELTREQAVEAAKNGEIVAEVTKDRETLAARVKVHSNLGSLILRTKKALTQGEYDRESLIAEWNGLTSLIFASDEEEDKFAEADKTASSVGVRIFYDGKRPVKNTRVEKIFASTVFECVVNTARHADGTELYVKMRENENEYSIELTNNGTMPTREIKEGGGLSSLRTMAENAGGKMSVASNPHFALEMTIPKEDKSNE